jgi:hypothetical protein
MFTYNITTKVDHSVVQEWLQWQKEIHIPEIMSTGFFSEHRFYKLLEHDDESGAVFVTQFIAPSLPDYQNYLLKSAPGIRGKSLAKWGEKAISFRTLLQNVQ